MWGAAGDGKNLEQCRFITCNSMLGYPHLTGVWTLRSQFRMQRVPLCSEHRKIAEDATRTRLRLCITEEGIVYPEVLMDSLLDPRYGRS